jgi:H+/Cl- antiporter ClcA
MRRKKIGRAALFVLLILLSVTATLVGLYTILVFLEALDQCPNGNDCEDATSASHTLAFIAFIFVAMAAICFWLIRKIDQRIVNSSKDYSVR